MAESSTINNESTIKWNIDPKNTEICTIKMPNTLDDTEIVQLLKELLTNPKTFTSFMGKEETCIIFYIQIIESDEQSITVTNINDPTDDKMKTEIYESRFWEEIKDIWLEKTSKNYINYLQKVIGSYLQLPGILHPQIKDKIYLPFSGQSTHQKELKNVDFTLNLDILISFKNNFDNIINHNNEKLKDYIKYYKSLYGADKNGKIHYPETFVFPIRESTINPLNEIDILRNKVFLETMNNFSSFYRIK